MEPVYRIMLASSEPAAAITTDMLTGLVDGIKANVAVILPVGIGLMAVMLGVYLVPALLKRFMKQ
jgi:hypothetical protein